MMSMATEWTDEDAHKLARLYSYFGEDQNRWVRISQEMNRTPDSCRDYWRYHKDELSRHLQVSPYPRYDQPLQREGDALVLPDPEFPFHHANFINRVLDLAHTWGIEVCIIAGDMLHFDSLSSWTPDFEVANNGGLNDRQEAAFVEFARKLGKRQQAEAFELLDLIGQKTEDSDPNLSEELIIARKCVRSLSECFKEVDVILGNHEARVLRQLKSPLFPTEITQLINMQSWRIAPYYYELLTSNNQLFRITHPKSSAKGTAETLAAKYQCNLLMAHSHMLRMDFDISGKFYAIHMGHCCDEMRLAYVGQRDSTTYNHLRGAVIVRDGVPYLLHDYTDWKRMEMMA